RTTDRGVPYRIDGVVAPPDGQLPAEHGSDEQQQPPAAQTRSPGQHTHETGDGDRGQRVAGEQEGPAPFAHGRQAHRTPYSITMTRSPPSSCWTAPIASLRTVPLTGVV